METDLKLYRSEFVPVSCNQGLSQEKGSWFSLRPASNVICWVNALITVDKVIVPTSHPTLTSGSAFMFILSWWIYAPCYFVIIFIFQEVSQSIGNFLPKGDETRWPLVCCFPVWQHLVTMLTGILVRNLKKESLKCHVCTNWFWYFGQGVIWVKRLFTGFE